MNHRDGFFLKVVGPLDRPILLAVVIVTIVGHCGCNTALRDWDFCYVRRSVAGLGIDTEFSTADITLYGQDEGVRIPVYSNAQTPPVVGRIGTSLTDENRRNRDVGRLIASGAAALALSMPEVFARGGHHALESISRIKIQSSFEPELPTAKQRPYARSNMATFQVRFHSELLVGAGIQVSLSETRAIPWSSRIGFQRLEKLRVPITVSSEAGHAGKSRHIHTPSTLVVLQGRMVPAEPSDESERGPTKGAKVQFFAVGRAATELCRRESIRRAALRDLLEGPSYGRRSGSPRQGEGSASGDDKVSLAASGLR